MRIKTLLCAAGVAALALPAMAQTPVYSLNVVGYINLPLQEGLNMIGNQLDFDGTGVNTTAGVLSSNVPLNTKVYTYTGSGYNTALYAKNKSGVPIWSGSTNLNPGDGAWLSVPAGSFGGGISNVTLIGQVRTNVLINPNMRANGGLSLLSYMVPISGGVVSNFNLPVSLSDKIYQWTGSNYNTSLYAKNKSGVPIWSPGEPFLRVGEGFWLSTTNKGTVWSNYFNVQ